MAKRNSSTNNSSQVQATFDKGMVTDVKDYHLPASAWTYARNAINNSKTGDLGKLSSEPSNVLCTFAPYTIIGTIHLEKDKWLIFSTNNIDSEIGIFIEGECAYTQLVNDQCLNFRTSNLIKGIARPSFDCTFNAYFADNRNFDRKLNTGAIPWVQECTDSNGDDPGGCITCTDKLNSLGKKILDCDKLRLESIIKYPCVSISKGPSAGSILNGSYHVHIAYKINGQVVTDYSSMSNIVSLFSHENVNNALDITLDNLDDSFDEYDLVVVSTISEKTVARVIGSYSTNQTRITLDYIDLTRPVIALEVLPILTPVPDVSEAIYENGAYALRVAPTDKFEFNYQPLANQIEAFWTCVEYDKDYYKNGGVNVGHMRDEVYPYFVRWIYNTGDKTKAYHIPGRAPKNYLCPTDAGGNGSTLFETDIAPTTVNKIESYSPKVFEIYNTASITSTPNTVQADGGILVAEGKMGYWESSEFYDDKNPKVWNSDANKWSFTGNDDYNLCGKPIRHHKFPENIITSGGTQNEITNHYVDGGQKIRVMGVRFENVKPPVDNSGKFIPGIVGYEILRGSRNGNKTVLYKGLINNMFEYDLPTIVNGTGRKGLYANYPFNDLREDPFISKSPTYTTMLKGKVEGIRPNDAYSKRNFTFHSPDVMFTKPFLVDDELKIYGEMYGVSQGKYKEVDNHPKHKLITNLTFTVGVIAGIGYAIGKMSGTRDVQYVPPSINGMMPLFAGLGSTNVPLQTVGLATYEPLVGASRLLEGFNAMIDAVSGQNFGVASANHMTKIGQYVNGTLAGIIPGSGVDSGGIRYTYRDVDRAPGALRIISSISTFTSYIGDGANTTMELIKSISKARQYALQSVSLCKYESFGVPKANNRRKKLQIAKYLNPGLFDLNDGGNGHLINHLKRQETVVLNTALDVSNTTIIDTSRGRRVADLPDGQTFLPRFTRASSHYVAVKNRLRNQYGQLENIRLLPTQSCIVDVDVPNTPIIYGGDTYIGRYSEKNTLYYFQQWLNGQPDEYGFDYEKYKMFEHTSFWINTEDYDFNDFTSSLGSALGTLGKEIFTDKAAFKNFFNNNIAFPTTFHALDKQDGNNGTFVKKNAYFHLFNSGVREFFVESELNIDYRDYGESITEKHYPITSDLDNMFSNNVIEADNYYKLDRSLCNSFLPYSKLSWGSIQEREYNPLISASCYIKRNKRVLYSLPQQLESKKDNWSVFLPYNYKDFDSEVTAIKPIDRTAAMILFKNSAPGLLPGTDTLQTTSGTKLQIGDGSLFARELQRLSNSDRSLEYASCQSRLSVVNTPAGLFFMSLSQGKIFQYAGGLKEISLKNNRFWLNLYLPYKLTDDFPTFDLLDNPVVGIGCQTTYDNEYGLVYFSKKDYTLKEEYKGSNPLLSIKYIGGGKFLVGGMFKCELGDPLYFNSACWTLSYDPKADEFVSFHDWYPDLTLSGKNTFLTTKNNGLWRHNQTCQSFGNFYGVDYPFEVEFQLDNKFQVATVKHVDYFMESFVYDKNCNDRFLKLEHNFDEATIYNTEQISGILKLNLNPKNDVNALVTFPKVKLNHIDILFSKEEQQYRFNQFWDITKDRGEFSNAMESLWKTEDNGFIRNINPNAINYNKLEFERKKFRHHNNKVILRKNKSENVQMQVSLTLAELLASKR